LDFPVLADLGVHGLAVNLELFDEAAAKVTCPHFMCQVL